MRTTMSSRQMQQFLDLAEQKGLTPDRMTRILSSGVMADVLDVGADLSNREAVRRALKLRVSLRETFILEVDYDEDLEAMIDAGNYNYCNHNITAKRFQITGKGIVKFEAKLVHLNRDVSSDVVEGQIKIIDHQNPWESGKIEHVLAFGKQFPGVQLKCPIVGLGSVAEIGGCLYVPCLGKDVSARSLDLYLYARNWLETYRFLAVRKISVS